MKSKIKKDDWSILSTTSSIINKWITDYSDNLLNNEINPTTIIGTQSKESFSNLLPIAIKIGAQKISSNLVSVQPMDGLTNDEREKIKIDISTINRDRKIDSILENKEFKEFKEKDHELFLKKKGPSMDLFYLDFVYSSPTYSNLNK